MAIVRVEELKTDLHSLGVRIPSSKGEGFRIRKGGAGPAEAVTLLLDRTPASVPVSSRFVSASPFRLEPVRDRWALFQGDERVHVDVALPPEPPFYRKSTEDGVPYPRIALMHGADCLASTVLQACSYWGTASACQFCGVGLSWRAGRTLLRKEPGILAEVAKEAKKAGAMPVETSTGARADLFEKRATPKAENAEKKGLKFFLNNYTTSAISIGFALSGFPRKTANTAEMRFFLLCVLRVLGS